MELTCVKVDPEGPSPYSFLPSWQEKIPAGAGLCTRPAAESDYTSCASNVDHLMVLHDHGASAVTFADAQSHPNWRPPVGIFINRMEEREQAVSQCWRNSPAMNMEEEERNGDFVLPVVLP